MRCRLAAMLRGEFGTEGCSCILFVAQFGAALDVEYGAQFGGALDAE